MLDAPGLVEENYQWHAHAKMGNCAPQADSDYVEYEGARGGAVEFVKGLISCSSSASDSGGNRTIMAPRILLTPSLSRTPNLRVAAWHVGHSASAGAP